MGPETRAALALVDAGLPAAQVDRMLRTLDIGSSDDAAAVTAKVEALTADMPNLFAVAGTGGRPRPRLASVGGQDPKDRARSMEEVGRDALRQAGIPESRIRGPKGRAQDRFDANLRSNGGHRVGSHPTGGDAA